MRDELIAFILARLARYQQFSDDSDILDDQLRRCARRLFDLVRGEPYDDVALQAAAAVFWMRYLCGAPGDRDADLLQARDIYRLVHPVHPELVPRQLLHAMEPGHDAESVQTIDPEQAYASLIHEMSLAGDADLAALSACVDHVRFMLDLVPPGARQWWRFGSLLVLAHSRRYLAAEDPADLDAMIELTGTFLAGPGGDSAEAAEEHEHLALFLESRYALRGDDTDRSAAISAWRSAVAGAVPGTTEHAHRSRRLGRLLAYRRGRDGTPADNEDAIDALRRGDSSTTDPAAEVSRLRHLGGALKERYERTADPADLDKAQSALTAAAAIPAASAPLSSVSLATDRAANLQSRYALRGDPHDLSEAVRLVRAAEFAELHGSAVEQARLMLLGMVLHQRHLATGAIDDLWECLDAWERALSASAADSTMTAMILAVLGDAADLIYRYTGEQRDRDRAADAYEQLASTASAEQHQRTVAARYAAILRNSTHQAGPASAVYRNALLRAADNERTGYLPMSGITALHTAIMLNRKALALLRPGDPAFVATATAVSTDLFRRHDRTGRAEDVHDALALISQAKEAVDRADDRTAAADLVARAWGTAFDTTGDPAHLEAAVRTARIAVAEAPGDLPAFGPAMTLGSALRRRLDLSGEAGDLLEAESLFRGAADHPGLDDDDRVQATMLLAGLLRDRYERSGDPALLTEAIERLAAATDRGPAPPAAWHALGNLYTTLHRRTAHSDDLRRSQAAYQRALEMRAGDHPKDATTEALDRCLAIASGAGPADLATVDDAIRFLVGLTESRTPQTHLSTVLAGLLVRRYAMTADPADLDRRVEASRQAVAAVDREPGLRVAAFSLLSLALRDRFRDSHDIADIREAVDLARATLDQVPPGHWRDPDQQVTLALALGELVEATADPARRQEALELNSAIAGDPSAVPQARVYAARWAGTDHARHGEWRSAAELFEQAVDLTPLVASDSLTLDDQQRGLGVLGRNTADGVACWLNAGDVDRAVLLLERGRAFLVSRAVARRVDLADLRRLSPELAERFEGLLGQLDHPDEDGPVSAQYGAPVSLRRAAVAAELATVTARIRQVPGQERFLLSPDVDDLRAAAAAGPLVLLNASQFRCDALVLTPGQVKLVPLPGVDIDRLVRHAVQVHADANPDRHQGSPPDPDRVDLTGTLRWLWDEVAGPILTALDLDHRAAAQQRLWFIPDGPFALLPLHAAGDHDRRAEVPPPTLIDRCHVSYMPSVAALIRARADRAPAVPAARVLAVAMPRTPGARALPGAEQEAGMLATRFGATVLGTARDAVGRATTSRIVAALGDHDVAHFACHGTGDWDRPAQPFLLIEDDGSDGPAALRMADITPVDLRGQRLAFLSACATARPTDLNVTDEAIHLTAAFIRAGYTHVIGTLWEVDDRAAALFADAVYSRLSGSSAGLDLGGTHVATRAATIRLRERYPRVPLIWAAHVHLGP